MWVLTLRTASRSLGSYRLRCVPSLRLAAFAKRAFGGPSKYQPARGDVVEKNNADASVAQGPTDSDSGVMPRPVEPSLSERHQVAMEEYHEWVAQEAKKDRQAMLKLVVRFESLRCSDVGAANNIRFFVPHGVANRIIAGLPIFVLSQRQSTVAKVGEDAVGKPDLGGPWTLVDSTGRFVSSQDLRGRYLLIYFGFSFCPDICSEELEKLSHVVELLEKRYGENIVQPVYISVDPQRDTVAQIAAYRRDFHPNLLALTGTPNLIKAVARNFRVYYNTGLRNDDEEYLVDHSIITYFMDQRGKFADFFGRNMTVDEIVKKIEKHITADRKKRERRKKGSTIEDVKTDFSR